MKERLFEQRHAKHWKEAEQWLQDKAKPGPALPEQLRRLAGHLAIARARRYSLALTDHLNQLALTASQYLYSQGRAPRRQWRYFLWAWIPQAVRENRSYVLWSALCFLLPLVLFTLLCWQSPTVTDQLLNPMQQEQFRTMYDPGADHWGVPRGMEDDWAMFGFYIFNNIRIDFQCFATGLLAGIGSLFFIVFNGLNIGAVAGFLSRVGCGQPFWTFVAGHSAPELIGAVLSGAGGLRLGLSWIHPGRYSRGEALRRAGRSVTPLIVAAASLTAFAAVIEAFVSSDPRLPPLLKFTLAATLWGLIPAYLLWGGRRHAH